MHSTVCAGLLLLCAAASRVFAADNISQCHGRNVVVFIKSGSLDGERRRESFSLGRKNYLKGKVVPLLHRFVLNVPNKTQWVSPEAHRPLCSTLPLVAFFHFTDSRDVSTHRKVKNNG